MRLFQNIFVRIFSFNVYLSISFFLVISSDVVFTQLKTRQVEDRSVVVGHKNIFELQEQSEGILRMWA